MMPECTYAIIATTQPAKSYLIMLEVLSVVVGHSKGDFDTSTLLDEGAAVSLINDRAIFSCKSRHRVGSPLRITTQTLKCSTKCVTFGLRGRL